MTKQLTPEKLFLVVFDNSTSESHNINITYPEYYIMAKTVKSAIRRARKLSGYNLPVFKAEPLVKPIQRDVVIFRKWKDGEIIALFPYLIYNRSDIVSYAHLGQHSGACYLGCIRETKPAKPAEYKSLFDELTQIGYNLEVKQKYSHAKYLEAYHKSKQSN